MKFEKRVEFYYKNLKRLLQVDVIDILNLPGISELELEFEALSAKVNSLVCHLFPCYYSVDYFNDYADSLNIRANELAVTFGHHCNEDLPTDFLLTFFRRTGNLGLFKELRFAINFGDDIPDSIVQELIRAALANMDLELLALSSSYLQVWDPHVETLLNGLKNHASLHALKLDVSSAAFGIT